MGLEFLCLWFLNTPTRFGKVCRTRSKFSIKTISVYCGLWACLVIACRTCWTIFLYFQFTHTPYYKYVYKYSSRFFCVKFNEAFIIASLCGGWLLLKGQYERFLCWSFLFLSLFSFTIKETGFLVFIEDGVRRKMWYFFL